MGSTASHLAGGDPAENFLQLIADTLQQLEPSVQGAFLQKFLRSIAGVEVSEKESVTHWQGILRRRADMKEHFGRTVPLTIAAADYFDTELLLRNPVFLEFQELREVRESAARDPLTGLYNRRLFGEYLSRELSRSRRHIYPFVLVLIDLRDFKRINDGHGHAMGDVILRNLSRACRETIRGSDSAFRIGGDEFALLLPQSGIQIAHNLAHRIIHRFQQHVRTLASDLTAYLDYGIASFPKDGDSAETLFEVADRNMYTHKEKAGRGPTERVEPLPVAPIPEPSPESVKDSERPQDLRTYNRILLEGTGAKGIVRDDSGSKEVNVLDLSLGGFSFLLDEATRLPEVFHARLQMHLFHSDELRARQVYAQRLQEGSLRVGCRFLV